MTTPTTTTEQPALWRPQPGPQTWLLSCPIGDILFGGARGGGKTDGCIGDWIAHQHAYGRAARGVWFRRTLPEIEEAELRMGELFPTLGARLRVSSKTWTFANGATIKLRYLERDQDATRYQGHSYTWMCFDELATWAKPTAVDMLRATLRSAAGVPVRMVSTANPGGVGHDWVRQRYIEPAPPLQPFATANGQVRVYIPSRISDNRALLNADPTYLDRLREAGPDWLVRAWLEGDWSARLEGEIIKAQWLAHLYDRLPERRNWERCIVSIDCANKAEPQHDWTAAVVLVELGQTIYIADVMRIKVAFPDLQRRVIDLCQRWAPNVCLIEDAANGTALIQQLRCTPAFKTPVLPVSNGGTKVVRLFAETPWFEAGRVLLPSAATSWLRDFRDELLGFPAVAHDDQVDAMSQGLAYLRRGAGVRGLLQG